MLLLLLPRLPPRPRLTQLRLLSSRGSFLGAHSHALWGSSPHILGEGTNREVAALVFHPLALPQVSLQSLLANSDASPHRCVLACIIRTLCALTATAAFAPCRGIRGRRRRFQGMPDARHGPRDAVARAHKRASSASQMMMRRRRMMMRVAKGPLKSFKIAYVAVKPLYLVKKCTSPS